MKKNEQRRKKRWTYEGVGLVWFFFLFNGKSTFMGYLMPKTSL